MPYRQIRRRVAKCNRVRVAQKKVRETGDELSHNILIKYFFAINWTSFRFTLEIRAEK